MSKTPTKYYQLVNDDTSADLYIFGDICAWAWPELGEQSGVTIVNQLKELDVDTINVHINSYGGDVSEGLAIYNVLREHKAQIVTICDGFACSAASVVFMAGDRRVATISEEEIKALMDAETWILPKDAVEYGFATEIDDEDDDDEPKQSAFGVIMRKLTAPESVLETQEIEVNIDVDKLAKELSEVLMKGTETPEQPKTGWAAYFERRQ